MNHDHLPADDGSGAADEPGRDDGMELLRPIDEDDAEIPVISEAMLHRERVDLEAGMWPVPPATIALMIACAVIYARQLAIHGLANRVRVVESGAMAREEVLRGELWRLVSAGFLHANAEHLIGNLIMLFILGMACEHAFGRGPFLFLYVSTCVTGSLLTMTSAMPTVGASGAIFGLAGALLSAIAVHRDRIELRDHRVAIVLAVWATYTLVLGLLSPIVSNACHIGGLLGGIALGLCLPMALLVDRRELASRPLTRLQAATAVAALVGTAIFFLPHLAG